MKTITHWIGGHRTAGDVARSSPVWNPATGEQQAEVALAGPTDVDAAVRCAAAAFTSWSQSSLAQRSKVLFALRELVNARTQELAEIISDEHGKVISDGPRRGPAWPGGDRVRLRHPHPDQGRVLRPGLGRRRRPLVPPTARGLRGDHPVQLPGHGADLDAPGGDRLRRSWDRPRSPGTSTSARAPPASGVQALGGAKNHAVILPDAPLDFASDRLVAAAFGSAGERCMAISAAVAVGSAGDELVAAVSDKARAVKVGPGREPGSEMARSSPPQPATGSSR